MQKTAKYVKKRDLKPFQAGIEAGCGMVMVSHNIVHCLDTEGPASISPEVISYLRNVMGFKGVIVTDSITMAGVSAYTICTSEYKKTYYALKKAVKNKRITEKRIDSSVKRILLMKCRHGII